MTRSPILLTIFFIFISYVNCLNFVSNALGSDMVLQRAPKRANLWGWSSTPGSTISVKFNAKEYTATSSTDGTWNVLLDATPAGGPYTISVSSSANEQATLTNVLFGDVYVCGGQSNMQMTVHSVFNASEEIQRANKYPNIRVFTVGQGTNSPTPLREFATIAQNWSLASAQSIGVGDWSEFSAACWFFGTNLYDEFQIPIGLFSDNWGGTIVQAWSSPDALSKCKPSEDEEIPAVKGPNDPSYLWNAMIVPILPMTINGAIWYQGESNAGQPNYYACAFPAMISDWRTKWGGDTSKTFGFYYVQLAPWLASSNDAEALTRLSQLYANSLPNVGFGTAADLGDPTSPFGNIHPRAKQEVGRRLSLVARVMTYGQNVPYLGPMASGWKVLDDGSVQISFETNSIGSGLVSVPATCDPNVPPAQCAEYEIGSASGWVAAQGTISGSTVIVKANVPGTSITGVRYGYANYPLMSLKNTDGLPGIPFMFPNPITPS